MSSVHCIRFALILMIAGLNKSFAWGQADLALQEVYNSGWHDFAHATGPAPLSVSGNQNGTIGSGTGFAEIVSPEPNHVRLVTHTTWTGNVAYGNDTVQIASHTKWSDPLIIEASPAPYGGCTVILSANITGHIIRDGVLGLPPAPFYSRLGLSSSSLALATYSLGVSPDSLYWDSYSTQINPDLSVDFMGTSRIVATNSVGNFVAAVPNWSIWAWTEIAAGNAIGTLDVSETVDLQLVSVTFTDPAISSYQLTSASGFFHSSGNAIIAGDYNRDGYIGAADFVLWRKSLGGVVPTYSGADASGNGTVDQTDYDIWRSHFGNAPAAPPLGSATNVPEPSSAGLALLLITISLLRRRRAACQCS